MKTIRPNKIVTLNVSVNVMKYEVGGWMAVGGVQGRKIVKLKSGKFSLSIAMAFMYILCSRNPIYLQLHRMPNFAPNTVWTCDWGSATQHPASVTHSYMVRSFPAPE